MNDRIGQQLGNYRLVHLLGQGSYAEVYLGQHVRLNLQAAIKLLHTHLTGNEAEHFQQEAQTIATLAHPAIVRIFDFDVQDGVPFLVMDYAPNGSLRQRYPKGSVVPLPLIVSFVKQVAAALQYAHEQKVIHRDVKPENMLVGRHEEVLLTDFGIATVAHSTASLSAQAMVGTITYMAPEQLQGQPRPASDQYALAVTVYEWLCGARPFEGSFPELVTQHLWQSPPPLQNRAPTISPEVEQVVLRALAKDPKSRFARVQDFALALEHACSAPRVFSAPSRGEATVAADPSVLSLLQSQVSAQLSPVDEPQVDPAIAIERNASLPTTPAGPVHARPLWKVPTSLTSFVGREQDVKAITALLMRPDVRLLTLTGPGGTGKTRLGLQVAADLSDRFTDGVFFVNLAPLTDPELVVSTIAQALGVREQVSQPLLESLKDYLRDRQLLLLLDNFEQVVSAAPVLAELLLAAPRLHLLVTSRTSLHLSGEHEFMVPPLSLPDLRDLPPPDRLTEYEAVRLFVERAQAVQADFAMTRENATTIAAICQQVDGLPLAIELAAGRSKLFSPQALLPRLRNRLKLLVGGARDLPLRQQTLRGTIAWSYDLLEEAEKILFRRLSVFVGGCTLEAAEAVCNTNGDLEIDILDAVGQLLDKSLLRQEAEIDGEPRLLMLETIREYALERLEASGEAEALWRRHLTFFLQLSEKAYPKMRSAELSTWLRRLERDHDNLRAALRWTLERREAQMGLRLAGALFGFWRSCNHVREGRSWLEQVLAQPAAQGRTSARAKALLGAGVIAFSQGDFLEAYRQLEESVTIGREVGAAGRRELANALTTLGHVVLLQGNPSAAKKLAGEGLQIFQEIGDAWGVALALCHLGKATGELGDPVAARSLLEESAAQFRVVGDRQRLVMPIHALGLVVLRQGDYAGARTHFEEALAVARETGDEIYIARSLAYLGTVALCNGDYPQSIALYQQSLAFNREQSYKDGIVEDLAGLAAVASLAGQPERAARLLGAVEALREACGISLPPLRRAEHDRAVEGIRAHLDEETFAAAWAQGRAMPLEQAIAYALVTKDALPTDVKPPEANQEDASSDLTPGVLSSPPSPPLSPRRALQQQFGGLTSREREVARLVAQGKSNRAIADELVVGVSTVEAHISHIFTKLGFSSRAQIAAWAVDKGLAQVPQDSENAEIL